ncbi:MAG: FAD:protein FMN transferase [Desulfobacterales bacterium]|nr:FAD:protein FMN transferase [Desulfobacterales bacterium]
MIADGHCIVDCGPMLLSIQATKNQRTQTSALTEAAEKSISFLERVAVWKKTLSMPVKQISNIPDDEIALRMYQSVTAVGDEDLTPMAAVAGTIADFVADWLFDEGMTKVIVNNGGDIAIRLRDNESTTVGIRPDIQKPDISHVIQLTADQPSWGVTTSGLGGRSFTRGIASAITTIAYNASIADASATSIANACFVEDKQIIQIPANKIDPDTDLANIPVTLNVGSLHPDKVKKALGSALQKAEILTGNSLIKGALIYAGDSFVKTDNIQDLLIS